jgi:hypothetical protein
MSRITLALLGLGLAAVGCGGNQQWTTDASWQGNDPVRRRDASEIEATSLTPSDGSAGSDGAQSWFGVRHDLSMRPEAPRTAACGCLAVEVGMPGKQAFLWDGQVPTIGPDAVIVAVSARGVACAAEPDEGKRRASISAVDRDGEDVILEIEELPEGRPLALGAVIPKPGPNGALLVRPKDKKVRLVPQGAASRCTVKSPVAAASKPAAPSDPP